MGVKIHALSSQPHYGVHLMAILEHLPDEYRGEYREGRVNARGIPQNDIVMVAGHLDIDLPGGRRTVLVDHGAGQPYKDAPQWAEPYYGGAQPDHVVAYIGPRQSCVDRYGLPGFAAGSPFCDKFDLYPEQDNVVGFTWHWRGRRVCPEADTALPHYLDRLGDIFAALRDTGREVIGHRHPRLNGYRNIYQKYGVEEVDYETLLRRSHTVVADNTTALYHAAYLLRDTLALNAPWYRKDVEHGLRFWSHVPGPQIETPDEFLQRISSRERLGDWFGDVSGYVWGKPFSDGMDGQRAATWLATWVAGL